MRLDHLLSREFQAEVIGETSALMAPRLIVAIDIALSSGERGAGPRAGEIEDDLAKAPIPPGSGWNSCHSSRVRVHRVATDGRRSSAPPGGRLAQLVRALP